MSENSRDSHVGIIVYYTHTHTHTHTHTQNNKGIVFSINLPGSDIG